MVGLQFLQLMLGYSPIHSAVCLLPLGFVVMPLSRAAPHVVDRFGQRAVMSSGLAMLGAGLAILSQLDADSTYWHFVAGLVVFGVGMAFTSTPATTAIVTSLPQSKQGVGSAVNDLSREFGSALGIAIVGSIFNSGYGSAVANVTTALPPEAAGAVEESPGAGLHVAGSLPDGGETLVDGVRGAFATGLQHALVTAAVIAGLAAVYTLLRGPSRPGEAAGESGAAIDEAIETPMPVG